jgi:hypothetical protein
MTKENPTHENISALEAAIIAAIGQPKPHRPPNPQCDYFLPPTQRHVPHGSQVSKIHETGRARCRAFALDGDTLCVNHSPSLCAQLIRAERVEASLLSRSQARP